MKHVGASLLILALAGSSAANGQTTRTANDTVAAYGARLTAPADTGAQLNARRVNNRISTRINNRISTRIERYRVDASADPAAALRSGDAAAGSQADAAGRLATPGRVDPALTDLPAPYGNTEDSAAR